jgi:hypothetical protein
LVEAMKETNTVTAYIMSKKVISSDLQKILSIYYQLSDLHVRVDPTHCDNATQRWVDSELTHDDCPLGL